MSTLSRVQTLREELVTHRPSADGVSATDLQAYTAMLIVARREKPRDALLVSLDAAPTPTTYEELDEAYRRMALSLQGAVASPDVSSVTDP